MIFSDLPIIGPTEDTQMRFFGRFFENAKRGSFYLTGTFLCLRMKAKKEGVSIHQIK
jgi:hypothetical protein